MLNFIKNVIPVTFILIGSGIELVAKILMGMSILVTNLGNTLHILFRTKTGVALIEVEESVKAIIKAYSDVLEQQHKIKTYQDQESNKLANTAKENTNVVQLGKKKDDDTKG